MPDFLSEGLRPFLPWLFAASVLFFVGSLVAVPIVVARLPVDVFVSGRVAHWGESHPVLRWTLIVIKNMVGALFLVAGIAMLVLPGQGLLTIVIGLTLLDYPGKRALEGWLLRRPSLQRALQWIRRRTHRPPLRFPDSPNDVGSSAGGA